jgi:hypothetical protein
MAPLLSVAAAVVLALTGAVGGFQIAQAAPPETVLWPLVPMQGDVCPDRGIQEPVDAQGRAVTIFTVKGNNDVITERTPIHQLTLDGSGDKLNNFCLDLERSVFNVPYCQAGDPADPRLVYLIDKYPPILTNRLLQAGRQAAVWHYTNGVDLRQPDATTEGPAVDAAVIAAYEAILLDVNSTIDPQDPPAEYIQGPVALSLTPTDAVHILPGSPDHNFKVTLTRGNKPLVGYTVAVTSTFGTLNRTSAETDSNGEAAFVLSSQEYGQANITASITVTLPYLSIHRSEAAPEREQAIGNRRPITQSLAALGVSRWRSPTSLDLDGEPGAGHRLYLPAIQD